MLPKTVPPQGELICAVATPPGRGALAIVRLSGQGSVEVANTLTRKKLPVRMAQHTKFFDSNNKIIDQGIAIYFQAPASFTGEDVVELHCHGNPIIADLLLQAVCEHGARLATPGEFSLRAFLNNKIDLVQAEAIADLISATTAQGVRTAARSLQGAFSQRVHEAVTKLIHVRTNIEAHLDFSDEDIEAQQTQEIERTLTRLAAELTGLLRLVQQGERLQAGATIAIAGKPNVGKSSLINALAQSDIAIVTEVPGTTRDPLVADIELQGMPVRLIDTAGLRDTQNIVEIKGIERAQRALSQADIVLWVRDVVQQDLPEPLPDGVDRQKVIWVHNKIDINNMPARAGDDYVYLSAKTGSGIPGLFALLSGHLCNYEQGDTPFLARRRHLVALQRAKDSVQAAAKHARKALNLELAAEELRLAQLAFGEVTGEFTPDDLLGRIFREFCIGK